MGPYYETRVMEQLNDQYPQSRLTCRPFAADGDGMLNYGIIMLLLVGVIALFSGSHTPPEDTVTPAIAALEVNHSSLP